MPLNLNFMICLIIINIIALNVMSHSRFKCPPSRSSNTGIKTGPCGSSLGDFTGEVLKIQPGPLTITFEESISHRGAPWRFSLSGDSDDTTSCVLLDHVPHNDDSSPTYMQDSTYTLYKLTIEIPDVSCERCALHFSNPMTDKIGDSKKPSGEGCTDPDGTCFSVYHSCTRPLSINGTTRRQDYICPGQPDDWPTTWVGSDGTPVSADVPGVYRSESSTWSDGWLTTVPEKYRTPASNGDLECLFGPPPTATPTSTTSKDINPTVASPVAVPTIESIATAHSICGIISMLIITIFWM